ncbi:prepilin-type N-terminal cleavage/methylation domain-containing protein [Candidatus Peregrinibacteria bacterium]|nr:MAG: prepilin-type N-terminal cleavage/methylation domain-containing protein [Candidatus Peregrinibacteria bacterium]
MLVSFFNARRGFSFIELIVVIALALFLIGLPSPMIQYFRSQALVNQAIHAFLNDWLFVRNAALSGKSIAALQQDPLNHSNRIADAYGLWIVPEIDLSIQYVEFQRSDFGYKTLYRSESTLISPPIHFELFDSNHQKISSPVLVLFERPYATFSYFLFPISLIKLMHHYCPPLLFAQYKF